jgi:hypothetical protein
MKEIIKKKLEELSMNYYIEDSISDAMDCYNCVHMICINFKKPKDYILAEVQTGDYWLGGDEDKYMDNSNREFDDINNVESYYESSYDLVIPFTEESNMNQFEEEALPELINEIEKQKKKEKFL